MTQDMAKAAEREANPQARSSVSVSSRTQSQWEAAMTARAAQRAQAVVAAKQENFTQKGGFKRSAWAPAAVIVSKAIAQHVNLSSGGHANTHPRRHSPGTGGRLR